MSGLRASAALVPGQQYNGGGYGQSKLGLDNKSIEGSSNGFSSAVGASATLAHQVHRVRDDLKHRRLVLPTYSRFSVWGIMFGCVVSGEAFGWNCVLQFGWRNLLLSSIFSSILNWCLCDFTSRNAVSIGFVGSIALTTEVALGQAGSTFVCLLQFVTMSLLVALNTISIATVIQIVLQVDMIYTILLCMFAIVILFLLNARQKILFSFANFVAIFSAFTFTVVLFLNFGAIVYLENQQTSNSWNDTTPVSLDNFIQTVPAAIWFFLGMDSASFTSEEVEEYQECAVKYTHLSMLALQILAGVILFFGPTFGPSSLLMASSNPLLDTMALQLQIEQSSVSYRLLLLVLIGPVLLVSGGAGLYLASRQLYALSRSGRLPRQLCVTVSGNPVFSTTFSCVVTFVALIAVQYFIAVADSSDPSFTTRVLMQIPTWTATVTYAALGLSQHFCYWRARHLLLPRCKPKIFAVTSLVTGVMSSILAVLLLVSNPFFYAPLLGLTVIGYIAVIIYDRYREKPDVATPCSVLVPYMLAKYKESLEQAKESDGSLDKGQPRLYKQRSGQNFSSVISSAGSPTTPNLQPPPVQILVQSPTMRRESYKN